PVVRGGGSLNLYRSILCVVPYGHYGPPLRTTQFRCDRPTPRLAPGRGRPISSTLCPRVFSRSWQKQTVSLQSRRSTTPGPSLLTPHVHEPSTWLRPLHQRRIPPTASNVSGSRGVPGAAWSST